MAGDQCHLFYRRRVYYAVTLTKDSQNHHAGTHCSTAVYSLDPMHGFCLFGKYLRRTEQALDLVQGTENTAMGQAGEADQSLL